ncbi:hypothetical protein J7K07_09090 [Candidatus Bathyarchaeota archaeon]|nr:hypothetical protein [Candidatus Bathyarchaeota archaeon]
MASNIYDQRVVVENNLRIARKALLVFKAQEDLDRLPSLGLLGGLGGPIKAKLSEAKESVLSIVLTFITFCLEHYLRKATGDNEGRLEDLIDMCKDKIGEKLWRDAHEMRVKRDVIIHNAGIIDAEAKKELRVMRSTTLDEGEKLSLTLKDVERYINTVNQIIKLVP